MCQNREKWGKSIKPVKRKATKGELVAGRATKAELRSQGSRASGRLRERSGQSVLEAPVVGTKKSNDSEKVTIEELREAQDDSGGEEGVAVFLYSLWTPFFSAEIYATSQVCDNA